MPTILEQIQQRHPTSSLLTKKESAMELKCSCATIDRLIKSAQLRVIRINGKILISINEIVEFIGE